MPVVLLYHDVVDGDDDASGFPGGGPARYKIGRDEFSRHLDAIAANHLAPLPSVEQLHNAEPVQDRNALLLTFDDGGVSAATVIADELEKRGWRGHFFITVNYIGSDGFVDRSQIRALAQRGHGIGSHSCSHPSRMAACSREQLLDEWRRSCETLSDILGQPVSTASVPGGYYSRTVAEAAAEAGITQLFNSEPTTRMMAIQGCLVFGRYTIYRGMTARAAGALATGQSSALFRQAAAWNLKKIVKAVGGPAYLNLRRSLLDWRYGKVR